MSKHFKAGVGRRVITPPLGTALYGYPNVRYAESVHDDLKVTAFAFEQGETKAILVTADICTFGIEESAMLRRKISEETGVPFENITLSAIHTHSGPCTRESVGWGARNDEYIENILNPQTVDACRDAVASLRDALMGVGVTDSEVGINRRQLTVDGEIILGQNPWGIFSKKMTVISFIGVDGVGIGAMVHYGAHCTACGAGTEITRDWAGGMCDTLEMECGMPVAFFGGQSGDTGPRISNGKTIGNIKYVEQLGALAGIDATRAYKSIKEYREPDLRAVTDKVTIPYAPLMPYEEAKAKLEAIGDTTNLVGRPKKAAGKYRDVMAIYENGEPIQQALEYDVTLFSLGEVTFSPFPFEVFSEIAIRIDAHAPFAHNLILNNTNGALAYFPTKSEIPLGGYEVFMFNHFSTYILADGADTIVVKEYLRILEKLK